MLSAKRAGASIPKERSIFKADIGKKKLNKRR
jgi:hypothetical protein